jgi:hypothetical protein
MSLFLPRAPRAVYNLQCVRERESARERERERERECVCVCVGASAYIRCFLASSLAINCVISIDAIKCVLSIKRCSLTRAGILCFMASSRKHSRALSLSYTKHADIENTRCSHYSTCLLAPSEHLVYT